jgi:hypothetical protein
MPVSKFQHDQEVTEELILKVYDQLCLELPKIFRIIQTQTLNEIDEYVNSVIEIEKYNYTLPECFGTFKAYLGDVPGNIVLNYKKPRFYEDIEEEKRLLKLAEKYRKEAEDFYKDRCRCCGRSFNSYENL